MSKELLWDLLGEYLGTKHNYAATLRGVIPSTVLRRRRICAILSDKLVMKCFSSPIIWQALDLVLEGDRPTGSFSPDISGTPNGIIS